MKKFFSLILLISAGSPVFAQYVNPNVKWSESVKAVSDNEFDLTWTAKISPGYHLYSQFVGDGGPIPTSFTFDKSSDYKLEGKVKESGNRHEALEPLFENMKLIWFEEKAVFTTRVKLLKGETTVKGVINFMTCNDRMCDPPSDHTFDLQLKSTIKPLAPHDSTVKSSVNIKDTVASASSSGTMDSGFNHEGNANASGRPDTTIQN